MKDFLIAFIIFNIALLVLLWSRNKRIQHAAFALMIVEWVAMQSMYIYAWIK